MTSKRMTTADSPELLAFWRERRYATLTTLRPDGTPHVVPVSVTYESGTGGDAGRDSVAGGAAETGVGAGTAGTARVVASRTSKKVRNIAAAGQDGMRVALCQMEGGTWSTLEGRARIRTDAAAIRDAEERYEVRYGRSPRPNPERVLIEIAVDRVLASRRFGDSPGPESGQAESGTAVTGTSGTAGTGTAVGRTA
jgi:hypothetical protein